MNGLPRYEQFFQTGIQHLTVQAIPLQDRYCAICRLPYPEVDAFKDETNLEWLSALTRLVDDVGQTPELKTVDDLDHTDVPNNDPIRINLCGYVFGFHCLKYALTQSALCPLCRKALYREATPQEEAEVQMRTHESLSLRRFLTDTHNWPGVRITVYAGAIAHLLPNKLRRVAARLNIFDIKDQERCPKLENDIWNVVICAVNLMDGLEKTCFQLCITLWERVNLVLRDVVADRRLRLWVRLGIRYVVAEQRILIPTIGADVLEQVSIMEVDMEEEHLVQTIIFSE
ncbi:hypothetical protein H2201_008412 [Coniosporium apollinis]|uniref:RING-type domain-containing protein n=2 Tax=Coniosporium TaxID=2810619 RepID=A0ABQ9NMX7_9PEZI|nr:hypothetical protein H2199_003344 [Cladosporium sp. JES 115]KAJ9656850.1 hypothetical protein H2201_008412 [Coniosporium apollinis]